MIRNKRIRNILDDLNIFQRFQNHTCGKKKKFSHMLFLTHIFLVTLLSKYLIAIKNLHSRCTEKCLLYQNIKQQISGRALQPFRIGQQNMWREPKCKMKNKISFSMMASMVFVLVISSACSVVPTNWTERSIHCWKIVGNNMDLID